MTNFFVSQTNPEIFSVIPRFGGIANIQPPERPKRLPKEGSGSKLQVGSRSLSSTKTGGSKTKTTPFKTRSKTKSEGGSRSSTGSAARKSLLSVSTAYDAPIDLDIDSCPRQYKVKQIIAATPWSVEFDEYFEPTEDSKRIPDPFQDAVDMLAMTISVIMLLSRSYDDISESHFKWVLSYLKCIKDEFGQTPPNVQGILNHINKVTGGKITSFLEDSEEPKELGEKSVRISPHPPDVSPPTPDPEPAE